MKSSVTKASARPRIIVLTTDPVHGLAGYVAELVMTLARRGCGMPVVLFCPANFEHAAEVRASGVDVVNAADRQTSYAGLTQRLLRNIVFVAKTAVAQLRLVRRGDIVHLQNTLHLPLGFAFFFVTFLRGGSVVLTAHDPLPHRWRLPHGLRWLERKMLKLSYRLSDRIIVHNQTGKDLLVRELRQEPGRIFVVPHGPYSDKEVTGAAYPHCDCLQLLAFGSIRENKGLHLAIRAVQMVNSDARTPHLVRLTIAGRLYNAGEEAYWQSCKQLIASRPENIEVIERHIEEDEIGPLFARHHAVLLPYTKFFSESGVANLALSHQRPIFATDTGGLGELIEQGACGIPIVSPSAEAVAQAICAAIQLDPERLQQMGIDGSRYIRRARSWDSIALQTAVVYSELSNCNTERRNDSRATAHAPRTAAAQRLTNNSEKTAHSATITNSTAMESCNLQTVEGRGEPVVRETGILESSGTNHAKRILILVTTLGFGGAEKQVVGLATELKARGWEVSVVCLVSPESSTGISWGAEFHACVTQLKEQHVEVDSLHMNRGVPDFRAVFRLRSLIRSFRPDVVHCHMYHANILGRITRLFCRIPALICTAHNIKESSRRGGPTWQKELLYRATDNLADHTTIICQAAYDRYVRIGAVPRKKLRMIPNGIDTDHFTPSVQRRISARNALGITSEFVWLAVGRLVVQKDYPTLFRALEQLERRNFVVLIAGAGPLEQELRQDCAKRGLSGSVRFCGVHQNVLDLYNAADAFVMSSECEGLPLSLLEAASMGLPSVVTNVGGNPEIVIDNVTGYVVPPGAPIQLAAAMQRLMEALPGHRKEMSRAARQRCTEEYRISAIVDRWQNFYDEYLQPRTPQLAIQRIDVSEIWRS